MATGVRVTLIISPRERFSLSERALASIYQNTTLPFRLIYVTGGAPEQARSTIEAEAERRGFEVINSDRYLAPNEARNLAIPKIDTEYAVFLDNDALVAPGWLEHLLRCADETNAWIVGPLYMIGEFERATIHMAGGRLNIKEQDGRQVMLDEQYLYDTPITKANMRLKRLQCEYVEFHCMLIRNEMFKQTGLLDEALLNLHEERDICLCATKAGHGVYIEPKSVVTYVPPPPCEWWDLPYFMLRWSEDWSVASVRRFNQKWGVSGVQHVSDEGSSYEEGTVVGFASAWRSRVAGLHVREHDIADLDVLGQSLLMTAMLASVDREYFSIAVHDHHGKQVMNDFSLSTPKIIMGLGQLPDTEFCYEVKIRPLRRNLPKEPVLVSVSNLSMAEVERLESMAFLVLQLDDAYQCWFALSAASWRKISSDDTKDDSGLPFTLAGSLIATHGETRVRMCSGRVGQLVPDGKLCDNILVEILRSGEVY